MNIYGCSSQPRHLITALDTFNYKLPYCSLFGGAVALTGKQFIKINGFPNRFFGWGGEDDDFYNRVTSSGLEVIRWDPAVARYSMLPHEKEQPNDERHTLLKESNKVSRSDGLSSLEYTIISSKEFPSYTLITVQL